MPQVEICRYCHQEIDRETDKFVVIAKGNPTTVELIAHLKCQREALSAPAMQIGSIQRRRGF